MVAVRVSPSAHAHEEPLCDNAHDIEAPRRADAERSDLVGSCGAEAPRPLVQIDRAAGVVRQLAQPGDSVEAQVAMAEYVAAVLANRLDVCHALADEL